MAGGRPWRMLPPCAADAASQMATDEAVLRAYAEGLVPPTLRFYTWSPPGVSCGRFQDIEAQVDMAACAARGYDVVRRPTGGRAVLHRGDLTYAVVLGEQDGLPAGTLSAYLHLSRGLVAGLAALGVTGELHTPVSRSERRSPACFASPSWYELTVAGRKVAGSAQRREGRCVLQHGAVIVDFVPEELAAILRGPCRRADLAAHLAGSAAGLRAFVPGLTPAALAEALTEGFARGLGVEIVREGLTAREEALIAQLRPKYATGSV